MNNENATKTTATPYDDVHRTMLNDCPKLTIYAPSGCYAEKYAVENNIDFVKL